MLEKKFKKKEQDALTKKGWVFIQLVAGGGIPMGFPDTEAISPTGYHCYIEWKQRKNSPHQPLQDYWVNKLNDMGHDAFFVHPSNVEQWRRYVIRKSSNNIAVSDTGGLPRPIGL